MNEHGRLAARNAVAGAFLAAFAARTVWQGILLDFVAVHVRPHYGVTALSAIAIAPELTDKTALVVDARLSLVAVWQAPRTAGAYTFTFQTVILPYYHYD